MKDFGDWMRDMEGTVEDQSYKDYIPISEKSSNDEEYHDEGTDRKSLRERNIDAVKAFKQTLTEFIKENNLGEADGEEKVILSDIELPEHTHPDPKRSLGDSIQHKRIDDDVVDDLN